MAKAKQPKWQVDVAIRVCEAAYTLGDKHRTAIEPRLPAGLLDGLRVDLAALRGEHAGAKAVRSDRSSSTVAQGNAASAGADLVSALRSAVRDGQPNDKALHKAFGVGVKVSKLKVSSVEAGLQTILKAAGDDPESARNAGLLPEDLVAVQAVKDALGTADTSQKGKKVTAKQATSDRNAAQERSERAVGRVIAAGTLAFRQDSRVSKMFKGLTPGSGPSESARQPTPKT